MKINYIEFYSNKNFVNYKDIFITQYGRAEVFSTNPELFDAIIKIRYFLQNEEAVLEGTARLELVLKNHMSNQGISYESAINTETTVDDKLLSGALNAWVNNSDFFKNIVKIPANEGILDPKAFFDYLQVCSHF